VASGRIRQPVREKPEDDHPSLIFIGIDIAQPLLPRRNFPHKNDRQGGGS
jgi:hypothetical protein